ncbi:unnamed protein product [Prorocentrum cordatum]|uniref:Uncharacterized protein n=1 Tax=Prorocentrum cordatum TaxID=2364126 RepID=A0ABN9S7F5_9DINO|nr:unnamed protein product [Polarella glacialis]
MWAGLHGAEGSMAGDDCAFACADARALAFSGQWRRTLIRCPGSVSLWRPRRAGPWPCCAPPSHHLAAWGRRIFFMAPQPRHTARRPGQGAGRRKRSSSSSLSRRHSFARCVPSLHEPLQWRRAHRGTRLAMRSPALARRGGGATCMS